MTYYPALTRAQHRARLENGWRIAGEGGNISDLARSEGVSTPAIYHWLDMWPDLRAALANGFRRCSLPPEEYDRRLTTVALADLEGRTRRSAAKELGITDAALSMWLRNRRDELQDTINEIQSERRGIAA